MEQLWRWICDKSIASAVGTIHACEGTNDVKADPVPVVDIFSDPTVPRASEVELVIDPRAPVPVALLSIVVI
jgi:hypothetical protein